MESKDKAQVIEVKWENDVVENMGPQALEILNKSAGMKLVRGESLTEEIKTNENSN